MELYQALNNSSENGNFTNEYKNNIPNLAQQVKKEVHEPKLLLQLDKIGENHSTISTTLPKDQKCSNGNKKGENEKSYTEPKKNDIIENSQQNKKNHRQNLIAIHAAEIKFK